MTKPTICGTTNHKRCCAPTMSLSAVEPARMSTPITDIDIDSSYEIICAVDRTEPSSGNFEPDDQPASEMPYTPIDVIEKISKMPALTSPTAHSVLPSALGEIGMIANVQKAETSGGNGASR